MGKMFYTFRPLENIKYFIIISLRSSRVCDSTEINSISKWSSRVFSKRHEIKGFGDTWDKDGINA